MMKFRAILCLLCVSYVRARSTSDDKVPIGPQFYVNEIFDKYGNNNVLTFEGFEHLLESLGLGKLRFDEHHDVSVHKINGSFVELHDEQNLHRHKHEEHSRRRRRHAQKELQGAAKEENCLSTHELLESFGLEPTHGLLISHSGFLHLCPAIVYELDQKHCRAQISDFQGSRRPRIYVWLEASISILIMSVAGLLCAGVVPLLNRTRGGEFLQYLIALAAGTLLGDSFIHLLPQVLRHGPTTESANAPLFRGTLALFSMTAMFMIEAILQFQRKSKKVSSETEEELKDFITSSSSSDKKSNGTESHGHSHGTKGTLACAVISGDIMHNITDGLSIGAAFSSGQGIGLACAIAVFCHELPHELGDYAVLLRDGMGVKRALLFNMISSVFSFVGMAGGIVLGEILHAAPWVNAFTAGTFIYIALVHLLPELKKSRQIGEVLCQTLGLMSGVTLMFFIGLYEEDFEALMST